MLDGILNNRKEWNAKKEEYEASLKALEEEKAAKESNSTNKGAVILWNNHTTLTCIRPAAVMFAQPFHVCYCMPFCISWWLLWSVWSKYPKEH